MTHPLLHSSLAEGGEEVVFVDALGVEAEGFGPGVAQVTKSHEDTNRV